MTPPDWTTSTLGAICEKPQYGFTASATDARNGPHFLRITDLHEGRLDWTKVPFCQCSASELGRYRLRSGDLVIARIGATTGRSSLVLDPPEAVFASYLIRLRARAEVSPFFLFYFTQSQAYWSWINGNKDNNLKGGVNASGLTQIPIALPSSVEQDRIAAVLWKIQRAIEIEEKLVAAARDLKRAKMRRLFTGGLRREAQRETDYGELPLSWRTQLLRECCAVQSGATKGRKIPPADAIDVPYLRVANVQDGHLDLREMKTITIRRDELSGYLLHDGDVVVTEGGDFDKLGRGFIWRNEVPNCIHQNHIFAIRANREILSPEFLAYLVQSPYGRKYFLTVAHKTTNLACINAAKLRAFPVPLPPMDEQREIATVLRVIDSKITVHERKRSRFRELFNSMLHQLMTGQIRVGELDVNVTEVRA